MPLDSLQTLFPMPPPRHNRKRKRRRRKRAVPCSPGLETTAPAPEAPPPPPVDPFTKEYYKLAHGRMLVPVDTGDAPPPRTAKEKRQARKTGW